MLELCLEASIINKVEVDDKLVTSINNPIEDPQLNHFYKTSTFSLDKLSSASVRTKTYSAFKLLDFEESNQQLKNPRSKERFIFNKKYMFKENTEEICSQNNKFNEEISINETCKCEKNKVIFDWNIEYATQLDNSLSKKRAVLDKLAKENNVEMIFSDFETFTFIQI